METKNTNYLNIKGWGVDADPKNEPTYPMKRYTGDDHGRLTWIRPTQQPETIEVLRSIERPTVSAVFGTAQPPSGLSGIIRRQAFKYSESSFNHWLPLLLADRINVVEGLIDDVVHGRMSSLLKDYMGKGAKAQGRRRTTLGVVAGVVLMSFAASYLFKHRRKNN